MICHIDDAKDPRLAPYQAIRHRNPESGFVAEGSLVVRRLLQSDYSIRSLLIHKDQEHRYVEHIPEDVPAYVISPELGAQVAGYDFHRGVLAHGHCRPMLSTTELTRRQPPVTLGLIGISDPENVGSLLRSAAAMNVHDIVIGPGTISPYVRRVIRVSMASVFMHRFYQLDSPLNQIDQLQSGGVTCAATTLRSDASNIVGFSQQRSEGPVALLVGNEATGLADEIQDRCGVRVTLPMASGTDSLNVSVAGAIFLHELTSSK